MKNAHISDVYYMLGILYETGSGVRQDTKKAKSMYIRSLAKGKYEALVHIGGITARTGKPLRGICIQVYALFKIIIRNLRALLEI